jgi:hypothetical protein
MYSNCTHVFNCIHVVNIIHMIMFLLYQLVGTHDLRPLWNPPVPHPCPENHVPKKFQVLDHVKPLVWNPGPKIEIPHLENHVLNVFRFFPLLPPPPSWPHREPAITATGSVVMLKRKTSCDTQTGMLAFIYKILSIVHCQFQSYHQLSFMCYNFIHVI